MESNVNIYHELAAARTKIAELKDHNEAIARELKQLQERVAEQNDVTAETEVCVEGFGMPNTVNFRELAESLPGRDISVSIFISKEREEQDDDDDD